MKEFSIGQSITLDEALAFSLELAEKGKGLVEPNPCVGAVLIDENSGKLISFGWHTKFGEPHAEVEAFKGVSDAKGLTMIVTLEPCSHYGKTPPCCDLVIKKNVLKLIYIDQDPNPKVSGKGIAKIKEAGITVLKADERYSKINKKINRRFFNFFENKKTYVHLKWAQSLDGKTSLNGQSKWITGEEARDEGHFLRAQSQMILVGKNTVLKDDPSLDVRLKGYEKKLKVAILDPNLELLPNLKTYKVFNLRPPEDVFIICSKKPVENSLGIQFIEVPMIEDKTLDLKELQYSLFKDFGVQSIYVEGGAFALGQFLKQKVFDQVSVFTAPLFIGGKGDSPLDLLQISDLTDKIELETVSIKKLGKDVFMDLIKPNLFSK